MQPIFAIIIFGMLFIQPTGTCTLMVHLYFYFRLEFEATDLHSGLHTLIWELHDAEDTTLLCGRGVLPARRTMVVVL